jgi:2,3-bisphosphoglycerate-independent phosphoglycerate mutase
MKEVGKANIGTMMGRYYAMDRSRNWNLTDLSVVALNQALGRPFKGSPINAVKSSWENDRTPDNYDMVDEYIPPLINEGYKGFAEGDCVFHTNFRQDRAIQLTQAFVDPNYPGKKPITSKVKYLGLTRYYDEFTEYLLGPMGGEQGLQGLLGEIISNAGLRQLRLAETQKFRHVTSFFNGKSTKPFPLEDQIEIKGRFDPASFASHPEMEAKILTKTFLDKYLGEKYDFIAINYANCDMVGHTGVLEAAIKAVEIVDQCLSEIVPPLLDADYQILITADHGNAEEMIDQLTGLVKTSHTLSPVELFLLSKEKKISLKQKTGKLSDLAPSILQLLDLPIPKEMTADSLIIRDN